MKSDNYMYDIYYNYLIDLYDNSKDLEAVQEVIQIKQKYPDFPFEKYVKGVFNDELINYYGMEFLLETSKFKEANIYNYGMNGELEKKKVEKVLTSRNLKKLVDAITTNEKIDISDLEKIDSILFDTDISDFLNYAISFPDGIKIIKNIVNKKNEYYAIIFLAKHFDLTCKEKDVIDYLSDNRFLDFIKVVDTSYFCTNMKVDSFMEIYHNFLKIILEKDLKVCSKEFIAKINAALFLGDTLNFEYTNIQDIDDFYEKRYSYIYEKINELTIKESKELISKAYYNCDYKELESRISDAALIFKRKNFDFKNLNRFLDIVSLNSKQELFKLINDIKNETNVARRIDNLLKDIATKDMINKLSSFSPSTSNNCIYLVGEPFLFLLHKIKGYGSYDMASKIYEDPSLWLSNPEVTGYISTSLCNESFFGLVDGNGYVLGFNNLPPDSIIGMGTEDIYMSRKIANNNLNNSKNRFLLPEDLIENTHKLYNEVSLKRIYEGRVITPDFVFSQDTCGYKEKEVANFFKVPIYILNSEAYANKMIEQQQVYLSKQEFLKYIFSFKKMYFSFIDNYELIYKYFRYEKMVNNIDQIIDSYLLNPLRDNSKLYELLDMVKEFSKLIEAKSYMEESGEFFDKKETEEKIKKKICS